MAGWVKLHRALQNWEWWHDDKMLRVFLTILMNVNHVDGRWQGHEVKKGQWITGRKKLVEMTGVSDQSIRTILKRLENSQEITIKSTSKFSVITVINWHTYQSTEIESTSTSTNDQPATNQQLTTNKNEENDKNEKKIYGVGENVKLTEDEYNKLGEKLNGQRENYIDRLSTYDKIKKYKSHYLTIISWHNKDQEKNKSDNNRPSYKRLT